MKRKQMLALGLTTAVQHPFSPDVGERKRIRKKRKEA